MLEMAGVEAGYGRAPVLRDFSLRVEAGEIVTLIGLPRTLTPADARRVH